MTSRRGFLRTAAGLGLGAVTVGQGMWPGRAHSAFQDYKALVVVHLNGGCDTHDMLVPTDGAYSDYLQSRPNIAVPRTQLLNLPGTHLGHRMGLNAAMSALLPLFERERLGFVVNAGALLTPTTAQDVLNGRATLPPFLYSHPEQTQFVQGWLGDADPSGWGGRGMEALSALGAMKAPLVAVDTSDNTLVLGQHSRMVSTGHQGSRYFGRADLLDEQYAWTRTLASLARLQSASPVEAEYARSFKAVLADAKEMALAQEISAEPTGTFETNEIGEKLHFLAKILPYYKSAGAARQIFFTQWGRFDTHANQRNTDVANANPDLDSQLAELANALAALDQSIQDAGMGPDVAVLVLSEFGRTLDEAAGLGSDHAWGSHWMVLGQPVAGGRLYGEAFPRLILGGVDDAHNGQRGYFVPQISSDQVAADLLTWLGLPASSLTAVLPNVANFARPTVGFMHG